MTRAPAAPRGRRGFVRRGPTAGPLALRPDVHAARVGDDIVFLDVAADAYSCLPGAAGVIALGPDGSVGVTDAEVGDHLLRSGLCRTGPAMGGPRRQAPPVRATLSPHAPRPIRPRHLADALAATADVARRYRGRSFADLLAAAGPAPSPLPAPDRALAKLVADFHAWAPYAPIPGKCLVRSFVLRRWLARRGHGSLWVFGVATWPFRAHCWLQCGEVALDDVPERLQAFRPILVL